MKTMIAMMRMIPRSLRRKINAPMISDEYRNRAKEFNIGIDLNLDNLLTCVDFCGGCPSKPGVPGEALFCSTGKSSAEIEMKGCNCLDCPLFEQCSPDSIGYFCKYGVSPVNRLIQENNQSPDSSAKETIPAEQLHTIEEEKMDPYLDRFTKKLRKSNESYLLKSNSPSEPIDKPESATISDRGGESHTVCYLGDELKIPTTNGKTLLETSLENNIPHVYICGGKARCSTCRVIVLEGLENCLPRNEKEAELAKSKGFPPEVRLACQTKTTGNVVVRRLVFDEEDSSKAIHEGKSGLNIAGTEIEAAVLFSDIRGFTSFSEKNLPYDIVHILNRYFNTVGEYIDKYGGYIDKYMGDGVMVTFGLEVREEHPAVSALHTAKEMIDALDGFNIYLKDHFQHQFEIGIGIHYGKAIVGNLGYKKKMEFTAIGDTVNTASRLESLNKNLKSKVVVSKEVYQITKKIFPYAKAYKTSVKGKEEKLEVYIPQFGLLE